MYLLREIKFNPDGPDFIEEFTFKVIQAAYRYATGAVAADDYVERVSSVDWVYRIFQNERNRKEPIKLYQTKQRVITLRAKYVQSKIA